MHWCVYRGTKSICVHCMLKLMPHWFFIAETPTAPLNVAVNRAEGVSRSGSINLRLAWVQPQNLDQFDIDRYVITVTSTSGIRNMTTACGECTSTVITVSENPNNVQMNTTFTVIITAVNLCGETSSTATASYTLSKLQQLLLNTSTLVSVLYVS